MGVEAHRLERNAVGLAPTLFQSITHMAPAAAVAFSITVGVPYAGGSIPLAVVLALVACLFVAVSIGQLARHLPSAGGLYTFSSRGIGAPVGFLMYPQAETAAGRLDSLDPDNFRYEITSKEITT